MASEESCKVEHLVVDSGPLIRNIEFKDIGNKIYCVREVVTEIRDKSTRERLQLLPYDLNFREPTPEAYQAVVNFSKKTGDFASLSAVDLKILALVYLLEKENVGTDHIRTEPTRQVALWQTRKNFDNPTQIAGFYLDKKEQKNNLCGASNDGDNDADSNEDCNKKAVIGNGKPNEINIKFEDENGTPDEKDEINIRLEDDVRDKNDDESVTEGREIKIEQENPEITESLKEKQKEDTRKCENNTDEDNEDNYTEEENHEDSNEVHNNEDDDGWITPDNIASLKIESHDFNTEKVGRVPVACLTTDFAMQNVLLQMGLSVVSANGLLIKRARSYVLRCYGCYKVTSDVTKKFCPKCGNATLKKVSVTVNDDGSLQYYISNRKPINTRGMRQSLPMPKGGKHANNPILCEDQKEAKIQKSKRSQLKYDVFDPDYCTFDSPFAPHDLNSRYAARRFQGEGTKKRHGHRK